MQKTELSFIIPCYNEEHRLSDTIKELIPAADALKISYEIILVNDGSKDQTSDVITTLADKYDTIKI